MQPQCRRGSACCCKDHTTRTAEWPPDSAADGGCTGGPVPELSTTGKKPTAPDPVPASSHSRSELGSYCGRTWR